MKPITAEWIAKAEGDWVSAQRELRARKQPNYDAACFHSQQCAEKYLKAKLEEEAIAFSRTHNLITLLALAIAVEPGWVTLQPHLNALNVYAVAYRYPGSSATKAEAKDALRTCKEVRQIIRQDFGLSP